MPDFVVLGHVTRDLITRNTGEHDERLGGAATYVSQTAARLGLHADLVTAVPMNFALLDPVRHNPNITMHEQPCDVVTTFGLDYRGDVRTVRLLHGSSPMREVGQQLRNARLAYLGPVIGELEGDALNWFPRARITVGLQGFMREADATGAIHAKDPPSLDLLARANAIVFSEHDHPDAEAFAQHIATRIPVVVLTRGARGATLFDHGVAAAVEPVPVVERDPTGAGDVFAAALAVWLGRDATPMDAARQAAYCAAQAVAGTFFDRSTL